MQQRIEGVAFTLGFHGRRAFDTTRRVLTKAAKQFSRANEVADNQRSTSIQQESQDGMHDFDVIVGFPDGRLVGITTTVINDTMRYSGKIVDANDAPDDPAVRLAQNHKKSASGK